MKRKAELLGVKSFPSCFLEPAINLIKYGNGNLYKIEKFYKSGKVIENFYSNNFLGKTCY